MMDLEMGKLIRLIEIQQYEPVFEFQEPVQETPPSMLDDLQELIDKLNNHYEAIDSEEAYGVELGMRRAADMIENLLKRYQNFGDNLGQEI